jgi:site-specific recombinase XerD
VAYRVAIDQTTGLHHVVDDRSGPVEETNRFLTAVAARGLSPRTIRAYAFDLLVIYRWLERINKPLLKLKECDLVDFIAGQRKKGARPRSINRRLTVCRLVYRFWTDRDMERGQGVSLPAPYYKGPGRDHDLGVHVLTKPQRLRLQVKVPRTVVEPLIVEEVTTFLQSLRRYRDLAIVYIMLLCGLRSREVLLLDVPDVSFEHNRLRIHGKGSKDRFLPMPLTVLDALGSYLRLERPKDCAHQRLFVVLQGNRRGQPMTPAGLRSLFRYRRSKLHVAKANPHRLRHTFGSDMARAGVRLPTLQKMMGHSSSSSTLQYINLSMADIADAYQQAMAEIEKRYEERRGVDK